MQLQMIVPCKNSCGAVTSDILVVLQHQCCDNAVNMSKLATSGTLPALNGSALTGVEGNLVLLNTTTISSAIREVVLQSFDDAYETYNWGTGITSNGSDQDYFTEKEVGQLHMIPMQHMEQRLIRLVMLM